jgi:hypothetical protein
MEVQWTVRHTFDIAISQVYLYHDKSTSAWSKLHNSIRLGSTANMLAVSPELAGSAREYTFR